MQFIDRCPSCSSQMTLTHYNTFDKFLCDATDHQIMMYHDFDTLNPPPRKGGQIYLVSELRLRFNSDKLNLWYEWRFDENVAVVYSLDTFDESPIPFFIPDLSDLSKLHRKLQNVMMFV